MAIRIQESFEVAAAPERVWAFLIDPQQVVECLPGAELLGVEDASTFSGRIRLKVGPVTASYRGLARFDELDAAARRVRMSGEGQESAGGGSARMTMTSAVAALPSGGSRVEIESEVDVLGRLAQFGRGMMEEVSREMFRRFTECVRASLEGELQSAVSGAGSAVVPSGVGPVPEAAPEAAEGLAHMGRPDDARVREPTSSAAPRSAPRATLGPPVRVLPLLWRALRNWLGRLLRGGRGG